ncbi:MAG TPA: hypothetical protein DDW26_12270 [Rhizobiales bacterium]|nr:hypothetical protein [Hyphomicrobiales bacterium]
MKEQYSALFGFAVIRKAATATMRESGPHGQLASGYLVPHSEVADRYSRVHDQGLVIGASGGLGLETVRAALRAGPQFTSLAADPLPPVGARLDQMNCKALLSMRSTSWEIIG